MHHTAVDLLRSILALIILSGLVACGGGGGGGGPDTPDDDDSPDVPLVWQMEPDTAGELITRDSWGGDIFPHHVHDIDYENNITETDYHQGEACSLIQLRRDYTSSGSRIICSDGNTRSTYAIDVEDGLVNDFGFLENGNLVIAEIIPANIEDSTRFWFVKLSTYNKARELVAETFLRDVPTEKENIYYLLTYGETPPYEKLSVFDTIEDATVDGKTLISARVDYPVMELEIHNDDIYLAALSFGLKVYRFEADLELIWDQQVIPYHTALGLPFNDSRITVDAQGSVYIAASMMLPETRAWEEHFALNAGSDVPLLELMLIKYDSQGNYLNHRMVAADTHLRVTDISVENEQVVLSGMNRVTKFNEPNHTTEWDLFLAVLDSGLNEEPSKSVVDINKEDFVYGHLALSDQKMLVWGSNASKQVDSNSVVSNGNGFVSLVSLNEEKQATDVTNLLTLEQPRDVAVTSMTQIDGSRFLIGGSFDGPITHTCDNGELLCYRKAMIGIYDHLVACQAERDKLYQEGILSDREYDYLNDENQRPLISDGVYIGSYACDLLDG